MKEAVEFYKEYQYFTPAARNALYGYDESVVRNYQFEPDKVRNKAKYHIKAHNGVTYELRVNSIKLAIYNTGIAIFKLECENLGTCKEGKPQNNIEAVKAINEYGRRINLPFIPDKTNYAASLCAERITLSYEDRVFETDFKSYCMGINSADDLIRQKSINYISNFIKEVLGYNSIYSFTSDHLKAGKDNNIYITPALDDRMFVACLVMDDSYAHRLLQADAQNAAPFEVDENCSKDLYELIFIDKHGDCSCMDKEMREEIIKNSIYRRWLDYRMIYGFSQRSMICLAPKLPDYLRDTFLTQYIQLALLTVAQAASLAMFGRMIAMLAPRINHDKYISAKTGRNIMSLKEEYMAYTSQLGSMEITFQEQGIETYELLSKALNIERSEENIEKQINSLSSAAEYETSNKINIVANVFTGFSIIALLISVLELFILGIRPGAVRNDTLTVIVLVEFVPYTMLLIYWIVRRFITKR